LVAFGLALAVALGGRDFCLDDAWIHLDYARSLKLGEGLSYNPGDLETGSSSPLWALLLALWPWGENPVLAVKILGALLHAASAALAGALIWTLAGERAQVVATSVSALMAGLLVAFEPSLVQSATSGMEVSLTAALLLACANLELRGSAVAACCLAWLATLARAESLFFLSAFGALRWASERTSRSLAVALASVAGLLSWMAYCLAVSGVPWPNTKYAKDVGFNAGGLAYLIAQVLPLAPWLLGAGGAVLCVLGMRRAGAVERTRLGALLGAWLFGMVATAISRPFTPGVLFYLSRYFAIFAPLPCVAVAFGVLHTRRTTAIALLLPVIGANVLLLRETLALQRAQEANVLRLTSDPARYIGRALPRDAVIVSENAGATRFFTPRSMRIVDMLGLNARAVAHAHGDEERLCAVLATHPTHLFVPDPLLGITVPLQVSLLRTFTDPSYSMTSTRVKRSVHLFALAGLKPQWRGLCAP
jgi:hypothetical protein